MAYSLGEAARMTGRNKSTILRAVRAGKISATRDIASGGWLIEPAELYRVFSAVAATTEATPDAAISNGDTTAELRELRARLEGTEARLADARDQIEDLRQERDRLLSLHEADQRLLADRREKTEGTRRRWWQWRGHA
jgi:hypothetical protein